MTALKSAFPLVLIRTTFMAISCNSRPGRDRETVRAEALFMTAAASTALAADKGIKSYGIFN